MEKKRSGSETILENDNDFLSFLAQECGTDDYQQSKTEVENGPHPPEDMLYDYVLGVMNEEQVDIIRDHISFCGICAQEVLQIRLAEEDLENLTVGQKPVKISLWERIKKWGSEKMMIHSIMVPGAGVAVACLIVLFLWHQNTTPSFELSKMLRQSYQMVLSEKKMMPDYPILRLPWESPEVFGFGTSEYSPSKRAFGAGLWSGKDNLSGGKKVPRPEFLIPAWQHQIQADDWTDTEWEPYFSMGKWSFLIQMVCHTDLEMPSEFWDQQKVVLKTIHEKFDKLPEHINENLRMIHKTLGHIGSVLDKKLSTQQRKDAIASELDHFIIYMSPR